jgi:hypothetical protein
MQPINAYIDPTETGLPTAMFAVGVRTMEQ